MNRRLLATATLLLGLGAVAGTASPAAAGGGQSDYANCIVAVDPATFDAGDTVTVTGTGLEPNFETIIEFNSVTVQIGTAVTDEAGSFETVVQIPDDATPGAHTITAVCDSEGNVTASDVTVSSGQVTPPGTDGSGGPLPTTGSDTEPLLVLAGVALLAGTAFVLVARRRRDAAV
jgi:LPXTG-motif cell wall-anchored protein